MRRINLYFIICIALLAMVCNSCSQREKIISELRMGGFSLGDHVDVDPCPDKPLILPLDYSVNDSIFVNVDSVGNIWALGMSISSREVFLAYLKKLEGFGKVESLGGEDMRWSLENGSIEVRLGGNGEHFYYLVAWNDDQRKKAEDRMKEKCRPENLQGKYCGSLKGNDMKIDLRMVGDSLIGKLYGSDSSMDGRKRYYTVDCFQVRTDDDGRIHFRARNYVLYTDSTFTQLSTVTESMDTWYFFSGFYGGLICEDRIKFMFSGYYAYSSFEEMEAVRCE